MTNPLTLSPAVPAAALVITHPQLRVAPMYAGLCGGDVSRAITDIRLVPVQAVDFFPPGRRHPVKEKQCEPS